MFWTHQLVKREEPTWSTRKIWIMKLPSTHEENSISATRSDFKNLSNNYDFLRNFENVLIWRIIKCSNWVCMLHKNDEINSTKRYKWGSIKQNLHNKINIYKQLLYKFLIQARTSSSSRNPSQTSALTISSSSSTLLIVRFTSIQFPTQFYGWKH